MSTEPISSASGDLLSRAGNNAERRRMSFSDLFFLAASGVIGSGWLLGVPGQRAGLWGYVALWIIVGALMLVVAAVMVKLSSAVPRNGGLVFLPWKSSGPLLATVVAASVWGFYAASPPGQAIGIVRNLGTYWPIAGMVKANNSVTWPGIGFAALFMLFMLAVNLLGSRRFLLVNNVLTAFKILVPLLVVMLLAYAWINPPSPLPHHLSPVSHQSHISHQPSVNALIGTVIFAYLGFQGPLDFAGNVKRRGIGEAKRLKRAVYGTVLGSILLYVSLQLIPIYMRSHGITGTTTEPYFQFVKWAAPHWARGLLLNLIKLDSVFSPLGTGMVYTYVLTREVAALSSARLTHRGLQRSRYSVVPASSRLRWLFGDARVDAFWLILIVDFMVSAIMLCVIGNWSVFASVASVLALVAYATPSVVLASLKRRELAGGEPARFPERWCSVLPAVGFVFIAVIFFLVGWGQVWPGMAVLAVGCLFLLGLPMAARAPRAWRVSRWYDADAHAGKFREWRTDPGAQLALVLTGFFSLDMLASLFTGLLTEHAGDHGRLYAKLGVAAVLAVLAWLAFDRLVTLSVRYMKDHPPTLPGAMPVPEPGGATPANPGNTATARAG